MLTAIVAYLLLVHFLCLAMNTLAAAGPSPTPSERNLEGLGMGFSPRPTQPPGAGQYDFGVPQLEKRQNTGTVCGYESGLLRTS
jgi:hypothetical protein